MLVLLLMLCKLLHLLDARCSNCLEEMVIWRDERIKSFERGTVFLLSVGQISASGTVLLALFLWDSKAAFQRTLASTKKGLKYSDIIHF